MPVTLTGQESFFQRQGDFIGEYNRVSSLYGSDLTNGFISIWSQFASSDQAAVQNLPSVVDSFRQSAFNYLTTLVNDGQQAMQLQVDRQVGLVPYTVQQSVITVAAQMRSTAQSINRPTLGATVTAGGSNDGNATVVTSTTNQFGDPLDMIFGETVTLTCIQDVGSSYQAPLQAVGQASVSASAYNWPAGSGANTSLIVADGDTNGIVTDGGFHNWTGTGNNDPVDWDITNGAAGVTVFKSAAGGVRGLNAAQITSDGTSLTEIGQQVSLSVNTVYCISVQAKISALTATGTFRIRLCDDNGTTLTDDAGNSLSYTRNINGQVTTGYQTFTVFVSTPRQLPTTVFVRYGFSVAATSGRSLYLSLANVIAATQLYLGGPFVAAVAGSNRTAINDSYTIAYTNSLGTKSFARGFDRLYGMRQLGVYLPSSGSATIADSLVTH